MNKGRSISEKFRNVIAIVAMICSMLSVNEARADVAQVVMLDTASFHKLDAEYIAGSPNPFFNKLLNQKPGKKNKKIAAALAFPITGITGIHRVYLGTAAYVPVVYVGTLGGCLGILPFIDFVVILVEKDISKFEGNRKIFMWVDTPKPPASSGPGSK